jgi:hypothetical protein
MVGEETVHVVDGYAAAFFCLGQLSFDDCMTV